MIIKRSLTLNGLLALSALLYAMYLAMLPIDGFIDRDNYLQYVQNSGFLLSSNLGESYLYLFSNEPLWLLINQIVGYFLSPEDGVRVLIFFGASVFYFASGKEIFGRRNDLMRLWLVFLFVVFSPQILKNFVIHLRQGVALAVFFLFAGTDKTLKRNVFAALLTAQIHSSFYFLFFILGSLYFFDRFGFSKRKSMVATCVAILILAPLASLGSIFFEARQGLLVDDSIVASGAAFVFWSVAITVLFFSLLKNKTDCDDWRFCFSFCAILLYLSLYYSFTYSGRIFESCLPLVVISLLTLPYSRLKFLLVMLSGLFVYQWSPLLSGDSIFRLAS